MTTYNNNNNNSMGQAYCVTLCGERNEMETLNIEAMANSLSDEPVPIFAKKVKQHIEIHPKIKETYLTYRSPPFIQACCTQPNAGGSNWNCTTSSPSLHTTREIGRTVCRTDSVG
jgi:hypothetical protein